MFRRSNVCNNLAQLTKYLSISILTLYKIYFSNFILVNEKLVSVLPQEALLMEYNGEVERSSEQYCFKQVWTIDEKKLFKEDGSPGHVQQFQAQL